MNKQRIMFYKKNLYSLLSCVIVKGRIQILSVIISFTSRKSVYYCITHNMSHIHTHLIIWTSHNKVNTMIPTQGLLYGNSKSMKFHPMPRSGLLSPGSFSVCLLFLSWERQPLKEFSLTSISPSSSGSSAYSSL